MKRKFELLLSVVLFSLAQEAKAACRDLGARIRPCPLYLFKEFGFRIGSPNSWAVFIQAFKASSPDERHLQEWHHQPYTW